MSPRKEWMLGIPGHNELVTLDAVLLLVRGGQLRPTDLVKKLGEPWRAANEVTDLAPHFSDVPGQANIKAAVVVEPPPPKVQERSGEAIRTTTDRVPRLGGSKTADSSKSVPKISSAPAEDRAPIRSITSRVPTTPPRDVPKDNTPKESPKIAVPAPAVREELKAETRRVQVQSAERTKTDKISNRKPLARRELPKPPPKPEPKFEPMTGKYYSPVDLLRSASFAFEPKKLFFSLPVVAVVMVWSIGMYAGSLKGGALELALSAAFTAILVFGLAFILVGLAFVTRRQLEGRDYYFGEVLQYTVRSATIGLVYPAISLVPSLVSVGFLFLFKLARNKSPGMAATIKVAYLLPMLFAFVAVLGALVYQVASMYVPAAAAVEGEGLQPTLAHAWSYVRRQWGRVVLHWLICSVAFGVISAVFVGLSHFAFQLPGILFGLPDDPLVAAAWDQFAGLQAIYCGLAYGLGMLLPLSLFSTLGTLSYLSLRHPAGAQLSPSPMDDTSGIMAATRGGKSPNETTNPSDTRPAPADASPPLSDISDDSDEQPLVKD